MQSAFAFWAFGPLLKIGEFLFLGESQNDHIQKTADADAEEENKYINNCVHFLFVILLSNRHCKKPRMVSRLFNRNTPFCFFPLPMGEGAPSVVEERVREVFKDQINLFFL